MSYDPLVFGKNNLERIVSIEVKDDKAYIFTQNDDGSVDEHEVNNRYWILAEKQLDKYFVRLDGELHYKWGKQFPKRDWFIAQRMLFGRGDDIFTIWNEKEALMVKDGYTYFKGMQPKDLSLLSIDIETTGLDPKAPDAKVLAISTVYRHKDTVIHKFFSYDDYENDGCMIDALSEHVKEVNPSLIIGHNIISFDLPYLHTIAEKYYTALDWGRNEELVSFDTFNAKFRVDGTRSLVYHDCKIYGREIVDTYFLSIKYDVGRNFEQYGLKPLIKQLGMEKEGRVFYDASKIKDNYEDPDEFDKIKEYCKDDAYDSIKLWDLMGPLFFFTTQMVPKSFTKVILGASGSQINSLMCRAYLQNKHSLPKADTIEKFEGALSWGKPGIYKYVKKLDIQSLYPSIMIQYEVYDHAKDPNKYVLQLVHKFRANRLEYKKLAAETGLSYYKDMDTAAKGILNSFYGFYGASGLSFNSQKCAEFITAKGREILKKSILWATGKNFEEIAPEYYENKNEDTEDDNNEDA